MKPACQHVADVPSDPQNRPYRLCRAGSHRPGQVMRIDGQNDAHRLPE